MCCSKIADWLCVVAVGIQSAISQDGAPTTAQVAGRAILETSVTPFATTGTATDSSSSVTSVVNGTISVTSAASAVSDAGVSTANS